MHQRAAAAMTSAVSQRHARTEANDNGRILHLPRRFGQTSTSGGGSR